MRLLSNPYAFTIGLLLALSALAIILALIHSPRTRKLALFAIALILALVIVFVILAYLSQGDKVALDSVPVFCLQIRNAVGGFTLSSATCTNAPNSSQPRRAAA